MLRRWSLALVVTHIAACGDGATQPDGTGTDTQGSSSTDVPTGSSTADAGPCSEVVEGDLHIREHTDISSFVNIGRVKGTVFISMNKRVQKDLSFLSCLHTIDEILHLQYNAGLESTEGLESLQSLQRIWIYENQGIRRIAGFDNVVDLYELKIYQNPALEEIRMDALKTVLGMTIGHCAGDGGNAGHPLLVDLSGFGGSPRSATSPSTATKR